MWRRVREGRVGVEEGEGVGRVWKERVERVTAS